MSFQGHVKIDWAGNSYRRNYYRSGCHCGILLNIYRVTQDSNIIIITCFI